VWLHATGEQEAAEIRHECPWLTRIVVASNVRVLRPLARTGRVGDPGGPLRIAFLSRIDRKKNLAFAIETVGRLSTPARLEIFGPVTDATYWTECQDLIRQLPVHVSAYYRGVIPNADVTVTLAAYDLFFLPTLGENFGHAILDALEAGVPVLISDRTPWRDLQARHAGWSLPLDPPDAFVAAIERYARSDVAERRLLRKGARMLAEHAVASSDAVARSRDMLRAAMSQAKAQATAA
jgi:glycosyltransferase involved in cell wall biosynthesis